MNTGRSLSSVLWMMLIVIGVFLFWRQIVFLILFLIVVLIAIVGYLYFRGRRLSNATISANKQRMDEEQVRRESTYTQTNTKTAQQSRTNPDVIDAEFTVKSKEID